MAQDEFVDLYALTGLEPSADIATIRKRLTEAYIDAQNNLDHRNAARRLQYQQLYEVYLPQARHLLLDPTRRAEYDRYLQAYKSGKPLSQVEAAPAPVVESGGMAAVVEDIPEMTEPDIDPEELAHQREELWNKWKSGLNFGEDPEPAGHVHEPAHLATATATAEQGAAPAASATAAAAGVAGPPNGVERRSQPRGKGGPGEGARRPQIQTVALGDKAAAGTARAAGHRTTPEDLERRTREDWERNREKQRSEIVNDALASTGLTWTFVGGGSTFVVALILLFVVDSIFSGHHYPLGMSRLVFTLIGFVLSVAVAAVGAVVTGNKMREKTRLQIGSLSLEELQRMGK